VKEVYKQLFEFAHEPHKSSTPELKTFFNIHSGGGERAIDYQIQTFKALSEYSDFSASGDSPVGSAAVAGGHGAVPVAGTSGGLPPVQIDLHIHLPENKTTRDYEAIIQDIARYIYGRAEINRG
jgi:hypothetical protein